MVMVVLGVGWAPGMGSYPGAFPVSGCCRKDVFWVHNLKLSLGRMRAVSSRGTSINGTPSSSQATVLKDFPSGLQIRPRRFDSGFGLHIRKPRRSRSAGFFYACDLTIASATFGISSASSFFEPCIGGALRGCSASTDLIGQVACFRPEAITRDRLLSRRNPVKVMSNPSMLDS